MGTIPICFGSYLDFGYHTKTIKTFKRFLKANTPLIFAIIFTLVLILHLGVLFLLGIPLWSNHILLSYCSNFVLAAIILWVLFKVFDRNKDHVGFLFMGSSLLKFLLFSLVFYPTYKADGTVQKTEAITFFIPYFTGLFLETGILVRKLNKI